MSTLRNGKSLAADHTIDADESSGEEQHHENIQHDQQQKEEAVEEVFHDASDDFTTPRSGLQLPKMDPFDREDVEEWLRRLTTHMKSAGARTEGDKFQVLMTYLNGELLMEADQYVSDEEELRPVPNPYSFVKEKLLAGFKLSTRQI